MAQDNNNTIQDAIDRIRRTHEPYAKKKPMQLSDLSVREMQKKMAERKALNKQKMQEDIANNSVDKIIPKKATTKFGSYANITGEDLITITPRAKDFNNAILETSQPLKHEVLYCFDKSGKVVARFKGAASSVSLAGDYEYAATLHNHPRAYGITTSPFSPNDIASYLYDFKKRDHYVVTESHVFKFNIGNMKREDSKALVSQLNTQTNRLIEKLFDIPTSKNNSCFMYFDSRDKLNQARHNLMMVLAKKYGFEYSVTTLEDFKKRNNIV